METKKKEIVEKMEEKGMALAQVAENIKLDPALLALYLAPDTYPMPKRIVDKIEAALQ